jgi:hypothetical protein
VSWTIAKIGCASLPTPIRYAVVEYLNFCIEHFKGSLTLGVIWAAGNRLTSCHRLDELLEV